MNPNLYLHGVIYFFKFQIILDDESPVTEKLLSNVTALQKAASRPNLGITALIDTELCYFLSHVTL